MFELTATKVWRQAYPGAVAGGLVMNGVENPGRHPELDKRRVALEMQLRERYAGLSRKELKRVPPLDAYDAYYRSFGKSYHVQLQLESLVNARRPIASPGALVQAMFMAELDTLVLTAGHDAAAVEGPVCVQVAEGTETFVRLDGKEQTLKAGDMFMADSVGVLSSVLHGPDSRTCITLETSAVFFAVYAPAGVGEEAVRVHLRAMEDLVRVVAPGAETEVLQLLEA